MQVSRKANREKAMAVVDFVMISSNWGGENLHARTHYRWGKAFATAVDECSLMGG